MRAQASKGGGRGSFAILFVSVAGMSASGAGNEALLDQFHRLSEKEQHEHILSLLELIEVVLKLFPSSLHAIFAAGTRAAQPVQQDTGAAVVRHSVPVAGRALGHGALLSGRQAPLRRRQVLPQLENHGQSRRALVAETDDLYLEYSFLLAISQ